MICLTVHSIKTMNKPRSPEHLFIMLIMFLQICNFCLTVYSRHKFLSQIPFSVNQAVIVVLKPCSLTEKFHEDEI